jgi:ATP-binding cassette, subfamily C (CFTR/MRP), member 1
LVEASVSVSRLNEFFQAPELQPNAVRREPAVQYIDQETVHIHSGTFKWSSSPRSPTILHDITFSARKGELSCLVGRVGAGKSSFLSALLGDMTKVSGEVVTRGKVAYVAQTPWIMNASVKENILFGHRYDADFYERTVEACAMLDDFKALPDGDNTEVGEKGISLSGGQKSRLALARAVYARADVYFLDDPLSAVDAHVGRHLIDNVIGPQGLLKSKTRVLATNAISVLSQADSIAMIRGGRIVETGSYEEVMNSKKDLYNLIVEFGKRADDGEGKADAEDTDTSSLTLVNTVAGEEGDSAVVSDEDNDIMEAVPMKTVLTRQSTLRRASITSFHRGRGKGDEERGRLTEQKEEHMEQGRVQWDVYVQYAKACSYIGIAAHLLLIVGAQTAQVGMAPPLPFFQFVCSNFRWKSVVEALVRNK